MNLDVRIEGLRQLESTFKKLPASTQNKAMRPALRKGGAVVRDAAAKNVKAIVSDEATGLLARSLRVYSKKAKKGLLSVAVMVKKGLVTAKGVRVGLYASVLEYGKKNQPPRSWIRKAARENINPAVYAVALEAGKRMQKAVEDAKR